MCSVMGQMQVSRALSQTRIVINLHTVSTSIENPSGSVKELHTDEAAITVCSTRIQDVRETGTFLD